MANAWIYQDAHQVQKHGADVASHYVGWYEPDGTRRCESCGPGREGKRNAEKLRKKLEAELMTGTYQMNSKVMWERFRHEYETRILAGLSANSRKQAKTALDHFQRIVRPGRVFALCTAHVDSFIAQRRTEPGLKKGSLVSPASVNADLRQIKAALNVAVEWGYVRQLPKFRMERVPKKLATYVNGDDFALIYRACETAKKPSGFTYPPADWWRGLLVMAYMTGWRIGDLLNLRRDDLDLDAGTAITRAEAEGNKGKRDDLVKLHPVAVEHLRRLPGFDTHVFPWNHNRRTLHTEFARVQEAAGIHLPCHGEHEHTRFCHVYGFHDFRRAFATMNADKLTPDALQVLMRHKSYQTTQVYINMARQMDAAVASLHVPEVLRATAKTS